MMLSYKLIRSTDSYLYVLQDRGCMRSDIWPQNEATKSSPACSRPPVPMFRKHKHTSKRVRVPKLDFDIWHILIPYLLRIFHGRTISYHSHVPYTCFSPQNSLYKNGISIRDATVGLGPWAGPNSSCYSIWKGRHDMPL